MEVNQSALTFEELATARSIIRAVRYLTVLGAAILVPMLVVLATPLVGGVLLGAIVLSPLLLVYVFAVAGHQAEAERRAAQG